MTNHGPGVGELVIAALDKRLVRFFAFPACDACAAACKYDPLASGIPRRFEDVSGANHVGLQEFVPGVVLARLGGEVHHRILAFEGRPNGFEIREVGLSCGDAFHRSSIERTEPRVRCQPFPRHATDQAAHARDEDVHAGMLHAGDWQKCMRSPRLDRAQFGRAAPMKKDVVGATYRSPLSGVALSLRHPSASASGENARQETNVTEELVPGNPFPALSKALGDPGHRSKRGIFMVAATPFIR